jgi:5-methylcytosine-specific restriction endonuclease McrA
MVRWGALLLAGLLAFGAIAEAGERDPAQRAAFRKSHPCPATGKTTGACRGYHVDHIKPLCAGGKDNPKNMQWLTVAEHKKKTAKDMRTCSLRKKAARA